MTKFILPALLFLPFATQAVADGLHVCNNTDERLYVSFANYENNMWNSHGWYTLERSKCTPLTKYFTNDTYYLYAYSASGKVWSDSKYQFCIGYRSSDKFEIHGADNTAGCDKRGFMSFNILDKYSYNYPAQFDIILDRIDGDSVIRPKIHLN